MDNVEPWVSSCAASEYLQVSEKIVVDLVFQVGAVEMLSFLSLRNFAFLFLILMKILYSAWFPVYEHDLEKEVEDSESCYFLGKGIFCFPWNELRGENNVQYEKQIVPLKKHIHCNCEENEPNLCAVHEDDEKYEESISFAKRMWKYGGYDDVQSTNTD